MIPILHANDSTETEWASVLQGLLFALDHDETIINIENDNLSVVSALIWPQNHLKRDYANYYRNQILSNAKETEWTGVRWIPRKNNTADELCR
jgi:ribonuclease HI